MGGHIEWTFPGEITYLKTFTNPIEESLEYKKSSDINIELVNTDKYDNFSKEQIINILFELTSSASKKNIDLENEDEVLQLFAIKISRGGRAPLTGEVISDARQDLDQGSRPSISMQMNANGAKLWRKLTSNNINRRIAIVLDDYVYSAPVVQNEIPNGNSQITGNFTSSFNATMACKSSIKRDVSLCVWGVDTPLSQSISFSFPSTNILKFNL